MHTEVSVRSSPYPSLADFAATWHDTTPGPPPWVHPVDLSLGSLDVLGLRGRLEDVLDTVVALQRSEWLQEGVFVGPRALPDVYRDVLHAARTLKVAVPPAIVSSQAYQGALGTDARAYLHLSSIFTTTASVGERRFAVGRLVGHMAARQVTLATLYALLVDHGGLRKVARQGLGPTLEFVLAPVSVGVRLGLSRWHRAAEVSADRAGLLCCGSTDDAGVALLRMSLGVRPQLTPDDYLEQLRTVREDTSPGRWAEILSTRPWLPKRIRALDLFRRSELWVALGGDPTDGELLSDAELRRRTDLLLRVG